MKAQAHRGSLPEQIAVEVDGVQILNGASQVEAFDLWDPNTADSTSWSRREANMGA